ncbi:hypothetical protein VU08_05810 [Desulfobulbus sp. F5]|nr:hypothetical protein [Desulfobulbus sp. F5]
MHENIEQPKKKSQPEGDFPKNTSKHDDVKPDDRQKARDEEREKRAAEKVQA